MTADTITVDSQAATISAPTSGYTVAGYAVGGTDRIEVLWRGGNPTSMSGADDLILGGYALNGAQAFQETILTQNPYDPYQLSAAKIVGQAGSGPLVVIAGHGQATYDSDPTVKMTIYDASGAQVFTRTFDEGNSIGEANYAPNIFNKVGGYHLEWEFSAPNGSGGTFYEREQIDYSTAGQPSGYTQTQGAQYPFLAYAQTQIGGATFTVLDNKVQADNYASVTLPGVQPGNIAEVAAAGLAGGATAAVAWVMNGGVEYLSIFNMATNSFGPSVMLDSGNLAGVHLVALADGAFALSWNHGGQYEGELFDSAGHGGGVLSLHGDFAGLDSSGDLFTVGENNAVQYGVWTYKVTGSGDPTTIGQTYTSDNNNDTWVGTGGNDVFHLGRGGDVVTGNGGDDTYMFAEMPWNGGHITDFSAGDVLDLWGMFGRYGYAGSTPVADGYLKITDDGKGDAQIWAQYATSGSQSGWWLVETLEGVSTGNVTTNGDSVVWVSGSSSGGGASGSSVSTSDANYTAPDGVKTITLTGSKQTVHANNGGDTIWSDDTPNTLVGGTGADTFHLGRAGDTVTGGGGDDTFAYATVPWGAGTITDFNAGDVLDLTGLLADEHYAGSDPISAGYLKITSNGSGYAQVWANYEQSNNNTWWLVDTLNGVSASSLQLNNGLITVNPGGGGSGGGTTQETTVHTSDADYTAPDGVTTIYLTGSRQTIHANNGGDTIWSDDGHNVLAGGTGNDTFHIGRGGDNVTGGAGADTFAFGPIPWGGSTIVDFNSSQHDVIDLTAMLADQHYAGSDPFADGYLKYETDFNGQAQIWANYNQADNSNWWLVTNLHGVSTSSLHYSNGLIT